MRTQPYGIILTVEDVDLLVNINIYGGEMLQGRPNTEISANGIKKRVTQCDYQTIKPRHVPF